MAREYKVLAVHGIGNHQRDPHLWQGRWQKAIQGAVSAQDPTAASHVEFVMHDHLFETVDVDWQDAIRDLTASWFWHGWIGRSATSRGFWDKLSDVRRFYLEMVAKWISSEKLRKDLRSLVQNHIDKLQPSLLIGHSLGSLICYDMLTQLPAGNGLGVADMDFLSIGSQIGHPSVRGVFGGRLTMPPVKRWRHILNPADMVFTAPVQVAGGDFREIVIRQNVPEATSEHDAVGYLADDETALVWQEFAAPKAAARKATQAIVRAQSAFATPKHRALIIGINTYASLPQLGGCVNDAFLMSSVLQETGFDAKEIRMLLDGRATADAIRERIVWLLGDVQEGDVRVLHYSGHGGQLPAYGAKDEIDHVDECLCPHDFDFTPERAIIDDWFFRTYAQLPYNATFLAVFDCCHSGGVARGGINVRGIAPPDDIRHRLLKWNGAAGMWEPRKLEPASPAFVDRPEFAGESGAVYRLGRAIPLRRMTSADFEERRKSLAHKGPYLPILFQACQEAEEALEVTAGAQNFGVFTYALALTIRKARRAGVGLTFADLFDQAGKQMRDLGYTQTPALCGPSAVIGSKVPLSLATLGDRSLARSRPANGQSKGKATAVVRRKPSKKTTARKSRSKGRG